MYRIRYQHVIHTCTVYLFRRKSKNSRWITKAAWPGDLRVYIYLYNKQEFSSHDTYPKSARSGVQRKWWFLRNGGILLQRSKYTADLYQGYAIYIIDIVGNQIQLLILFVYQAASTFTPWIFGRNRNFKRE